MSTLDVAVVGTGPGPDGDPSAVTYRSTEPTPSSMGYVHGEAYADHPDCSLVGCADLVAEHARRFAEAFGLSADRAYTDHAAMLAAVEPDVVSVCTPPTARPDIVVDCATAGVGVRAIHAEKPLGWPWGECRRMVQECARRGVQLTVGHQQRLSDTARQTREWVEAGAIGALERVEISRVNLFDAAAHQLDLCNWFAGDRPAEWVLGNVDYRERNLHKGVHHEQGAVALWKYPGGVFGFITVGTGDALLPEQSIVLRGSEGTIERAHGSHARLRRFGEAPETVAATDRDDSKRAVEHAVDCLRSGERSPLDAAHALNAMELTYGIRESARRRGRVEFPLTVEDDPLEAMVESGALL